MPKSAALRIVYVVDGDASVREGMSRLMDSAGLEARPCASVPEFLDQARGMRVACVLLDIWGARQCEIAVRQALLAVAKVLPVIALSSSDDPAARQLARELGAPVLLPQAGRCGGTARFDRVGDAGRWPKRAELRMA